MKLKVINSNSQGNAYLLQAESNPEVLLIEAGVHITEIKKALNYDIKNVTALVSHSHNDHSRSMEYLMRCGIDVYASMDTHMAKGTAAHHRAQFLEPGQTVQIGWFRVKPFSVNHDVPTLGFLIYHPECGLTLFLTDTFYCDYTFPKLNNILVECNHDMGIVRANGCPSFLSDRIIQSHMNIETCRQLLAANDLSAVNNIVLIHLSDSNSDARHFKQDITKRTGKTVTIAEAGLCIPFNKEAI